jgi:hypothetical protein
MQAFVALLGQGPLAKWSGARPSAGQRAVPGFRGGYRAPAHGKDGRKSL